MAHQFADQHRPLRVVSRRRDVGAVVENRLVAGCQRGRHEAQFDERPHADRQQKVEDLIGIEERIEELLALADQRAHVVRQDAMEAHVLHAEVVVRSFQLCSPVGAQAQGCVAAPDRVLPKMRQRRRSSKQVAVELCGHDDLTKCVLQGRRQLGAGCLPGTEGRRAHRCISRIYARIAHAWVGPANFATARDAHLPAIVRCDRFGNYLLDRRLRRM